MKICLIGNNLTNYILAYGLLKKNIKVDLYIKKNEPKFSRTRTIGLSYDNKNFINNNIFNIDRYVWPIKEIKIFNEKSKDREVLNFSRSKEANFFIFRNSNFLVILKKLLKKNKNFKFKNIQNEKIYSEIENNLEYCLIVNSEINNNISKKYFSKIMNKKYNSVAYTSILKHNKISNNIASQTFTDNGPLAFLPLSNTETSVVYSVKNKKNHLKNEELVKLVKSYSEKYKRAYFSKFEKFYIKFSLSKKYYHRNILLFGDALHKIHPLAGQGFNMTVRDMKIFFKLINENIDLGLPINTFILKKFEKETKSKNLIFAKGIDLINDFFILDNVLNNKISKNIFPIINKSVFIKNYINKIASKGLNI